MWLYGSQFARERGSTPRQGAFFGTATAENNARGLFYYLINPHRLNIFPRCKIQNYTAKYALSDGIWVHIICVKI
jgi:hypothetical protein